MKDKIMSNFQLSGNIVDIVNQRIYAGSISVENGKIIEIIEEDEKAYTDYIMPGFIDSHVHIESSMLIPTEFARLASVHGTVATVSDPHEIANVLGIEGVLFMVENASETPFKFYFGAPSCVPATDFETSGAKILATDIRKLLEEYELKYLSEMMNFPGVLYEFPDVMEKINIAKELKKPIDGHAPGLRGDPLKKYISAGITTDHECFTLEEALDKISNGMKILIREGSAAKNFNTLYKLVEARPDMCMFCSDDKHPNDLVEGHINLHVKQSIALGFDLFKVLQVAILNPIDHYGLDVGLLEEGDDADFIIVDNLKDFNVKKTFIKGINVAANGKSLLNSIESNPVNKFVAEKILPSDLIIEPKSGQIRVIEIIDGELITNQKILSAKIVNNNVVSDIENDILKIAVYNRYKPSKPSIAFIHNFGLKTGALASSIAHDSHNILAIGTNDDDLCKAINAIIDANGGMAIVNGDSTEVLALPVGGIMTNEDGYIVAKKYSNLDNKAKKLGSNLKAPFMGLSFMALLVIPKIKLSDKGLFDGEKFEFIDLFV